MRFQYRALAHDGQIERGVVEALSVQEAMRQISEKGIEPVLVEPEKAKRQSSARISFSEVIRFFEELSTLLSSGVALVDALSSQAENQTNTAMEQVLSELTRDIEQGKAFSEALANSPRLRLPPYMTHLVEAGELTGKLAAAIESGVGQMQYEENTASEIRNALAYPAILVCSGVAAIGLVFALVVPKFTHLLDESVDLPLLAELVLRSGLFLNSNAAWVLAALLVATLVAAYQLSRPRVRASLLELVARWPLIGTWLAESESGRWTSVLAALLGSGVPVIRSLDLANQGVQIRARRTKMEAAAAAVKGGEPLSAALLNQQALTPVAYNILRVGEQSGKLPAMLQSLAALYERTGKRRMKRVLVLIEPLAILLIGSVIGTIIIGIVLAITSSADMPL